MTFLLQIVADAGKDLKLENDGTVSSYLMDLSVVSSEEPSTIVPKDFYSTQLKCRAELN